MANEIKTSQNHNPDQFAPEDGWPQGMFPSPIVDEFFNPYDDPQNKLDYYRMGGSQDEILRHTTLQALKRHASEPSSYPDHYRMMHGARGAIDRKDEQQIIKDAFRRRER